jgi:hypothetical protein
MKKVLRIVVILGFFAGSSGLLKAHATMQWDDGDGRFFGGGCSPRYNPITQTYTAC